MFDDYAHHPTEVRATLEAARTLEPRRLFACFQPHLYSRTRRLYREFGKALVLADVVDGYVSVEQARTAYGVVVDPDTLTVDEAADLLRTTRRAIYAMIERRQLPGVTRVRRRVLLRADDLLDWLDQKRAPSSEEL